MRHRSVARLGLVLVVLGFLAWGLWPLSRGVPGTGAKGSASVVRCATALATAPTVAPAVAPPAPGRLDGSDRADRSASAPVTRTTPATAPRPADPLTAAAEGVVAPVPIGVQDRYAKNEVLDERIGEVAPDGTYERVRIVKTSMKYPLVRVEERFQVSGGRCQGEATEAPQHLPPTPATYHLAPEPRAQNPSSDTLLSQTAMVADHVNVKVKPGTTEAELAAVAAAHGGTILRRLRVPGPGSYLVQFPQATLDTVPNALAALGQVSATVGHVNPDYVVYAAQTTPNDPLFSQLYGMHNTSQIAGTGLVVSATNPVSGSAITYSPVTNGVTGTLHACGLGNPGDFPAAVVNNIALIQRGTLSFAQKAANAKAAGAKAVVIYNNAAGAFAGTFLTNGAWLPTLAISDADGAMLLAQTNTSVTVTIYGCKLDADIDAPEAWDLSTGSTNVIVGVIDTGVDYNHPDLRSNMWVNAGEIPGNGVDDDHNGWVDDVYGIDACNNDGNPMDDHFHGTHVSGTIGGIGNNGIGVAGVCWTVRLMALKFLSADGGGNISDASECVAYATSNGVRLTSNSWGGGGFDQTLHDLIADAGNRGILFVAAAGNSSGNNDATPVYPGSYDCSNIICVAATDSSDVLASFSCYGQRSVDLAAPGVGILSCYPTYMTAQMTARGDPTNYNAISGTSMATPHVAGACALMAAAHPELSAMQIKTLLLVQTDQIPALAGKCATGGRLNIGRSIVLAEQPLLRLWGQTITDPAPGGNGDGRLNPGETGVIAIKMMNASTNGVANVTSTLATTNSAITIVTNTVVFGAIPGLTELSGSNAFVFTVAPSTPPQPVLFDLVTTDGAGHAWTNLLLSRVRGASRIAGTVRYDGAPGIGFRVLCNGQDVDTGAYTSLTAFSDLNGMYSFDVLDGSYALWSYWPGNQNCQRRKYVITPPDATNVDFEATTVTISGRVTDARTGNPVTNATVDYYVVGDAPDANDPGVTPISWKTSALRGTTTVDTNGNYTLSTVMMTTSLVSVTPWVSGYSNSARRLVTVPTNAPGVDFAIAAPDVNIAVTPAFVSRSVKIGTVVTQTLVIANSGGASMPWTLWQESDEGYQAGTPLRDLLTTADYDATYGIAYDGNAVCLVDTFNPVLLYRHNPASGALLDSWSLSRNLKVFSGSGLDWDGVNFLVVDANTFYKDVRFIDPVSQLTVKSVPVFRNESSYPNGGVLGGGYLWLNSSDGRIIKADPRTGATLASFASPAPGGWGGLEFFSGALWVVDSTAKKIVKVSPSDGHVIRTFSTPAPYGIQDLAKDRAGGLWLLDYNNWDYPRVILIRIGTATWLNLGASSGTVAGGGSNTVQLTFNAATAGLGVHTAMVSVATSDPDEPEKLIPVLFTVTASQSPLIDSPAAATPNPVILPATAALSVGAHDPDGDPLVFTWSQVSGPGTATFTPNGTAASSNSVAGFSRAGTYVLRVTVGNTNANETATSDVTVYAAGIETDLSALTVPEGSHAMFRARLVADPLGSVTVSVARVSGDADLTVSGGSPLVFDSGNWSAWQTVTLAAAVDADVDNGSATMALSAAGLATAHVAAMEQEAGTILNVLAGMGGTVSPAGPSVVTIGSSVTVSAAAHAGRSFARWVCTEGSVVFTDPLAPTTTVTVAGAATIRANFGPMSGAVKTWGYNAKGQIGDGTTSTRYAPVTVLYGGQPFTNVTAVAVGDGFGDGHTLALRTDSNVWAWGYNGYGQLGLGDTNNRANPVPVTGISNVIAVAAGYNHSVALDSSSNVWTWGQNCYGQLGDGTTSDRTSPWRVTGVSNVVAMVAGNYHTLALDSSSNVWGWGYNPYGQLGDGTSLNRLAPVRSALLSNVTAIASASFFTLALKSDGSLWICGSGGGFPTDPAVTPQQVAISEIVAFSAGGNHSLALKADGSVWAWGRNLFGQLGDGNLVPVGNTYPPVRTLMSNAVAIAAGGNGSLALDGSGGVWGWGYNEYGQTGNGTNTTPITPAKIAGSRDYVQIAAGSSFSAAIQQGQPYISVTTSVSAVSVPEGGTNTFQVRLNAQPWTNVTLAVVRESGDGDLGVLIGTNLTFTPSNWSTWQTVVVAAAEDADASNSTAVVWISGADTDARVTATEAENDATLTVYAGAGGSVNPNGATVVTRGSTNTVIATPDGVSRFVNWSVLAGSATIGSTNAATTTAVITNAATLQANFTPVLPVSVSVLIPTNGMSYYTNGAATIAVTGTVMNGFAPFTVTFYTNTGSGNYAPAGSVGPAAGPVFPLTLSVAGATTNHIYAVVVDSHSVTNRSATNTFYVVAPFAPTVDCGPAGATGLGIGTATLNGRLLTQAADDMAICWATSDCGAASTSAWPNVVHFGAQSAPASVSTALAGLTYGIRYWYRVYATNAVGEAWSAATNFVTTAPAGGVSATGGTVTNVTVAGTNFTIHVFTNSGVLSVTQGGSVEYLVVGGGGGGGKGDGTVYSSGGGGGGYRSSCSSSGELSGSNSPPELPLAVVAGNNYTVTIGAGGAGGTSSAGDDHGKNGEDTVLGPIIAKGGGGGARSGAGYSGGSGGGGNGPGSGTIGQGYGGGQNSGDWGGGGGGAGGAGQTGMYAGVPGGAGLVSRIFSYPPGTTRAAGGTAASGGTSGAANTGNGGNGHTAGNGGNGGSGIVIVRYVTSSGSGIGLANTAPANVLGGSATLQATLTGSNVYFDVWAYWGPTDGTNNPAAWSNSAHVGAFTLTTASTNIAYTAASGIVVGTNYCTFFATNAAAGLWAAPSTNFTVAAGFPPAPTGVTAVATATNAIALVWSDNATNELGYVVNRSMDSTNWVLVGVTAAGATNLSDTGLATNTLYHYRVAASNAAGLSAYDYASARTWTAYEAWQHAYFTVSQLAAPEVGGDLGDPDGDHFVNWMEYAAGTDPLNPISSLVLYATTNHVSADGVFVVRWQSVTGRTYAVMASTNLLSGFTNLATTLPATPPMNVHTDNVGGAVVRFYRVRVE